MASTVDAKAAPTQIPPGVCAITYGVRARWNWAEYLTACHPGMPVTFEAFEDILAGLYADYTFESAAAEAGLDAAVLAEVAVVVAGAGTGSPATRGGLRPPATSAGGRCPARCS